MKLKSFPIGFLFILSNFQSCLAFKRDLSRGVNGGVYCAACIAVTALTEQLSVIHNETFVQAFERICNYFPDFEPVYKIACMSLGRYYIPQIIQILTKHVSADVICNAIKLCYTEKGFPTCHAFPPKGDFDSLLYTAKKKLSIARDKGLVKFFDDTKEPFFDPCVLPGVRELCHLFNRVFNNHHPLVDWDNDYFSSISEAWRGWSWRGRDCDDFNHLIRPGAIDNGDTFFDKNCNGIFGFDPATRKPYEELLCKDTGNLGLIVLGDSVAAHFHLPPQWLNSSEFKPEVFQYAPFVVANEVDWPQLSLYTGYFNQSKWALDKGNVSSIYMKLFQRNHCNHRDYQNLAKNGADSFDANNILLKSLNRRKEIDQPALVIYSLIGNDVCNHWHDFDHMTTPEQMRTNLLKTLDTLDKQLPNGSHVLVVGMVDGRVLYNNMHDRIHPIGSLNRDITYSKFYDFLNCLHVSPCYGYMNSNETVRNFTAERSFALTAVMREVVENAKYNSFDVAFIDNPFPLVLEDWKAKGNQVWELIEPSDGFHPRLVAESLIAEVAWKILESKYPHMIGKINPNNAKIRQLFGDQGGY